MLHLLLCVLPIVALYLSKVSVNETAAVMQQLLRSVLQSLYSRIKGLPTTVLYRCSQHVLHVNFRGAVV